MDTPSAVSPHYLGKRGHQEARTFDNTVIIEPIDSSTSASLATSSAAQAGFVALREEGPDAFSFRPRMFFRV